MSYVSLYRKYRSQTFDDLIGQDHVVRTLQNAISSDRIAHSYLFTGPRGTGKTSTARLLAKALCCESGPTPFPDNTCEICRDITAGSCIDVIEMDAASESGVEEIRKQIVETVEYQPMVCRFKVYIIDEVHDLSRNAFDALLKTIEEPPPHIKFILATTEFNKVPPTIRSRCQKFEFHRATIADLVSRLEYVTKSEGFEAEPAALAAIARMADGGYRDALTLLEQAILTTDSTITLSQVYDQLGLVSEEVVDALLLGIKTQDVPQIMDLLAEVSRLGRDPRSIIESMLYRLQDLTRAVYQPDEQMADATRGAAMHETAVRLGRETVLRLRSQLADAHRVIREISIPRLWLESELVRISTTPTPLAAAATDKKPTHAVTQPAPPRTAPSRDASTPTDRIQHVEQETAAPSSAKAGRAVSDAQHAHVTPVTNDEVKTEVQALWDLIVSGLPPSTSHARRLQGTRATDLSGGVLTVEVVREMDLEWLTELPARAAYLKKVALEQSRRELSFRFLVAKPENTLKDDGAVEFPAEGQRLEQLAREIFGQG